MSTTAAEQSKYYHSHLQQCRERSRQYYWQNRKARLEYANGRYHPETVTEKIIEEVPPLNQSADDIFFNTTRRMVCAGTKLDASTSNRFWDILTARMHFKYSKAVNTRPLGS